MIITKDKLNNGQKFAAEKIYRWIERPHRPFILQGYAGTGKTSLVLTIIQELQEKYIRLIAPTGKAARVLTAKTGEVASTIHSFLYKPVGTKRDALKNDLAELVMIEDPTEEVQNKIQELDRKLRELAVEDAKFKTKHGTEIPDFLIADESSMITERMGEDLDRTNIPTLYIGDPFQLRPVRAKCFWDGIPPDHVLEELVRFAGEGSGIPKAAEAIRLGRQPVNGPGFQMYGRGELKWRDYLDYDVVLCGSNNLRRTVNNGLRKLKFPNVGDNPIPGERIVCLSNNYQFSISNGETFDILDITRVRGNVGYLHVKDSFGRELKELPVWMPCFTNDLESNNAPSGFGIFTFGYCMTVHKFQGSEAPRVLLLDDWAREDHDKWTYTGITRASHHCSWVRS